MTPEQSSDFQTDAQFEAEWNYRYQERLRMLCEDGQPTELEKRMATDCADEVLPF